MLGREGAERHMHANGARASTDTSGNTWYPIPQRSSGTRMERADLRQLQQRAQMPQHGNMIAGPPTTTRRGQPAISAGPLALQDVPRPAAPASDEEDEDEDDDEDEEEEDDENRTEADTSEDSDDDDDEDEIKEPTLIRIAVHAVLLY